MTNLQQVIDYTNARLNNWYDNAKIDFGILGKANCIYDCGLIVINYEENGEKKQWSFRYYPEENHEFYFNIWMEEA